MTILWRKNSERRRPSQAGFTLVEILIALFVMAVGLMGVAALFVTAIASNQRSKVDSGATLVSETVLDQISAHDANNAGTIPIVDCTGVQRNFSMVAGAANNGAGATLIPVGTAGAGSINWAGGANGYTNNFVMCGPAGTQLTYEVRWNVMAMPGAMDVTSQQYLRMVAVSSRQLNQGNDARLFNPPVTLRTVVGMN